MFWNYIAAPFSPSSLTGLTLWLDATDSATVVVGMSPHITQWTDKSGHGYNFVEPSADAGPNTGLVTINGLNTIQFTANRFLSNTSALITGSQAFTMFYVFQEASTSGYRYLSQFKGDGSGNSPGLFLTTFDGGSKNINFGAKQTGGTFGSVRCDDTFGASGVPYDFCLVYNGSGPGDANYEFYSSNVLQTTKTAQDLTITTTSNFMGAGDSGGGSPLLGQMGEVIIYNRALSSLERGQVASYLVAKWGV